MTKDELEKVTIIASKNVGHSGGGKYEFYANNFREAIKQAGLITGTVKPEVINNFGIDVWFCECGEFILKDQKYCRFCGEIDWSKS